ncbi:hypothetical protein [Treponema sp. R6D11]
MKTSVHGTLVLVHGEGVLITGAPEIGKSEAALTLIKWGHNLVSDDKVDVTLVENTLIGRCPPPTYGFVELRGVGVVDIHEIYGQRSLINSAHIDLVAHLTPWDSEAEYDRFGEKENYTEILGKEVPFYEVPMRVGRNIATIIEVLALHHRAKKNGYFAHKKLTENVKEFMRENQQNRQED